MADTKRKGDIAEAMVLAEVFRRGYRAAIPVGEDWPFDLIVERRGKFERVQCKYTVSDGRMIKAKCSSTNNWVSIRYTKTHIDWLAVYDRTSDACYYIPAEELGDGRYSMHLRLRPAANRQEKGLRWARDYMKW